ncbi:MAG: hypothetical protein M1118_04935 [Chloroflexi bacterium]|nr:hypothetical protein [Chloroflexota bacterium]
MTTNGNRPRQVTTRGPLNLAELIEAKLIELTEIRIADSEALLTVESELLEQLDTLPQGPAAMEARDRLLGYHVEPRAGDIHDYVERRIVTEYLIAIGVDAVALPLTRGRLAYSHVARDASLVAIPGDIAPDAIVHRLTSCPRLLIYRLDSEGLTLQGLLFRRVATPSNPQWPDHALWLAEGENVARADDLRALVDENEQYQAHSSRIASTARTTPTRRRAPHIPLRDDGKPI